MQDIFHFSQARRQFAAQFALVFGDDRFQGSGGHFIFIQGFGLGRQALPGLLDQAFGHAQRIVELEFQARGIVERGADVLLQVIETAERPQAGTFIGIRLGERALGQFGGNRKQPGLIAKDGGGVFQDEVLDFLQGSLIFEDVQLVHHQDDLLAPGQDALQELTLAFGQGMVGRGDEQHQVAARDELIGQPFVAADNGIRAGRIDNVQFLQERQGIGVDGEALVLHLLGGLLRPT